MGSSSSLAVAVVSDTKPPVPPTKTKRPLSKKAIRNARNKAARAARRNNR